MNQSGPATADRLLRTARRLFAARGYDQASVRAITRGARANLGAITYHFGSKWNLYATVVDQMFGAMADRLAAAAAPPGPATDRLSRLVDALFAFFVDFPEAPRIIMHALARGGQPPEAAVPHLRRNLDTITRVVRDGQAAGELRAVDPFLVTFSLLSQSIWFAVARRVIGAAAGRPLDGTEAAAVVARHISDATVRTLRPDSQGAHR
jgi:AcrR family transcriptional regulator